MAFFELGNVTRELVLGFADLLKENYVPGLVVLILICAMAIGLFSLSFKMSRRYKAIKELLQKISVSSDAEFAIGREQVTAWYYDLPGSKERLALREAWDEFNKTVFVDDTTETPTLRNAARPSAFFNIDDLHFGPGFLRILPGLFVSIGLALTFLGLIAALNQMSGKAIDDEAMKGLLTIASAKFIMSLTGLACSIVFTIVLRQQIGRVENVLHALCLTLEKRLTFISLEQIAQQQLGAIIESRDYQRQLGYELVAELSRPMAELPGAISVTITDAIKPLLLEVGKQGTEAVGAAANELAKQLSASVAGTLTLASDKLALAADRISQLIDHMNATSGQMGAGMEQAVERLVQVVDALRKSSQETAKENETLLTQGAEQLLNAMNTTLQGIRDNTSDGARAMSAAASEIREAITGMRKEIEEAGHAAKSAAGREIKEAADEGGKAVRNAGAAVSTSFQTTAAEITRLAEDLARKMAQDLVQPLSGLSEQLQVITASIVEGTTDMRRMSEGVRDGAKAGADAAGTFRTASQALIEAAAPVRATTERIESSVRSLSESMGRAAQTVTTGAEQTTASAERVLGATKAMLGEQHKGISAVLDQIANMLAKLNDEIKRVDNLDETFGRALTIYTKETDNQMQAVRNHVQNMSDGLGNALSSLHALLDGLKDFEPQQKGR